MPVECLADKRYAKAYSGIKAIGQEIPESVGHYNRPGSAQISARCRGGT
jgi:hypothetical protein